MFNVFVLFHSDARWNSARLCVAWYKGSVETWVASP